MMLKNLLNLLLFLTVAAAASAQTKEDTRRLAEIEPVKQFYDSLVHNGASFSMSIYHDTISTIFIGTPVNREYQTGFSGAAFRADCEAAKIRYDDMVKLYLLMKKQKCLEIGSGGQHTTDYFIAIVYKRDRQGRKYQYNYAMGTTAAAAFRGPACKSVGTGIYKTRFAEH